MLGLEEITEDVVRGWVETKTIPTAKIGRLASSTSSASAAIWSGASRSSAKGITTMSKPLPTQKTGSICYLVEMSTLHGPTRQRRWHRVHQGASRADCQRWIEESVSCFPTEAEARHSFSLTRDVPCRPAACVGCRRSSRS
jgi:hypothetical protein